MIGEVAEAAREILGEKAKAYDKGIDTLDVMEDHAHVFLSSSPRYSPARVTQVLKSLSARELFARFP